MSENIQDFIINRPSVAARDTSLIPNSASEPATPEPELNEESQEGDDGLPVYGKRLAINLQKKHQEFLSSYAVEQHLTPEILVEAMVAYLQNKPKVLADITKDAAKRLEERKEASLIRSSLTILRKRGFDI